MKFLSNEKTSASFIPKAYLLMQFVLPRLRIPYASNSSKVANSEAKVETCKGEKTTSVNILIVL